MNVGLITGFGVPGLPRLERMLDAARAGELTYDHAGSTLAPGDRRVRRRHVRLGTGPDVFAAGQAALRTWRAHRGIGATVHPPGAPLVVDQTLLVVLRAGPLWVVAPNRVVAVVDDEDRFGFAYGSLPGHPAQGEESFTIERDGDIVRAVVTVDARPGTYLTRSLSPGMAVVQHLSVSRYLGALAASVDADRRGGCER